jgi:fatty-acyl-CoA synthase
MQATMMHMPTTVQMILRHGARIHGTAQVSSFDGAGLQRSSFAEIAPRIETLAHALDGIGVKPGDRVATFCWNHQAHLEAYFAAPCMSAILHTVNLRLHPDQIAYIFDHAADKVLLVDASLLPLLEPVWPKTNSIESIIVIGDVPVQTLHGRAVYSYDALMRDPVAYAWPDILDDRQAAAACYTSGTTGNPKGVVYSHRSIFLHSLAAMGVDTMGIHQADRILLLPSMFHANAWGMPFTAWFAGADLILPGPHLQPAFIRRLIESGRPTLAAMVPTLINDLLRADEESPLDMSSFRTLICGGSAVAPALIEQVRKKWGIPILQGWGMTETSPMGTFSIPPRDASESEEANYRSRAGRPVPGIEVRLVDESGAAVSHNGTNVGELQLRGPWVTGAYHNHSPLGSFTPDGWLRTGDVGAIDPHGYVRITDRTKDVIKSGGEWVSSVELEGALLHHPDIVEAAVIAHPDPRWEERPLAIVVLKDGRAADPAALRDFLRDRVARFWLPEYWSFVASIPKTSVGKLDKRTLRNDLDAGALKVVQLRNTTP